MQAVQSFPGQTSPVAYGSEQYHADQGAFLEEALSEDEAIEARAPGYDDDGAAEGHDGAQ